MSKITSKIHSTTHLESKFSDDISGGIQKFTQNVITTIKETTNIFKPSDTSQSNIPNNCGNKGMTPSTIPTKDSSPSQQDSEVDNWISKQLQDNNISSSSSNIKSFRAMIQNDTMVRFKVIDKIKPLESCIKNLLPKALKVTKDVSKDCDLNNQYAEIINIETNENFGINVNFNPQKQTCKITGNPNKDGKFYYVILCKLKGVAIINKYQTITIEINVAPDPKTLWVDNPVPSGTIFNKPNSDSTYLRLNDTSYEKHLFAWLKNR